MNRGWWMAAATLGVVVVLAIGIRILPPGVDYITTFRPAALDWLHGKFELYDSRNHFGFHNLPWAMVVLLPFALLPERVGLSLLTLASLGSILLSTHLLESDARRRWRLLILAIANLHTLDLVVRGQLDALVLLGICLAWSSVTSRRPTRFGVGLVLMSLKPLNTAIVALLLLWGIRRWPIRDLGRALAPTLAVIVLSFPIFGWDWPLRYLAFEREYPVTTHLSISIWRLSNIFRLPAFLPALFCVLVLAIVVARAASGSVTRTSLGLALAGTFLVTPYANGDHYVLLVPALAALAGWSPWAALAPYAATFTPLLRLGGGPPEIAAIDLVYPALLYVFLLRVKRDEDEKGERPPGPSVTRRPRR